ncbi:MAG: hypothetical protein ACM3N7_05200 [Planctomycetaceae bacterium]
MKLTCAQRCRVGEWLGNLKCPNCFSARPRLRDVDTDKNAQGRDCQCELKYDPELLRRAE